MLFGALKQPLKQYATRATQMCLSGLSSWFLSSFPLILSFVSSRSSLCLALLALSNKHRRHRVCCDAYFIGMSGVREKEGYNKLK